MLQVFDFPEPSNISGRREVTTVSTQALFLMNSSFAIGQAEKLAEQMMAFSDDDTLRIERVFRLTLGRYPTDTESTSATRFLGEMSVSEANPAAENPAAENPNTATSTLATSTLATSTLATSTLAAWTLLSQSLFGSAEFRYLE